MDILSQNETKCQEDFHSDHHRKNSDDLQLHFAPQHWEDLKRSGLSDGTIQAARIFSVSPRDIDKILGGGIAKKVESLLGFPYPNDGGFIRYKLFPFVVGGEGHKQKYFQKKDSKPCLYFPPGIEKVLSDPSISLTITEGEKKALKASQEGIPTIGSGGVWNWTKPSTYDLISDFDKISLSGRKVDIVFDSDVLFNLNVLLAAYRLAKALMERGAIPHLVIIPPREKKTEDGKIEWEKIGLDDFLVEYSAEEFQKLKRILLTSEMIEKEIASQLIHRDFEFKDVSTKKSPSSRCRRHTIKVFDLKGDSTKTLNFSAPCRAWDCSDCYPYLLNHWLEIILNNFPLGNGYYSIISHRKWEAWKKRVNGGFWFRIFSGTAGNYLCLFNAPVKDSIPVSGQRFNDLLGKYLGREPAPLNGRRKVTHSRNIELPEYLKNRKFEERSGKRKKIAVLIPAPLKEVVKREKEMGGKIIEVSDGGETITMESPKALLDRYRSKARGKVVPVYNIEDPLQMATILGRV